MNQHEFHNDVNPQDENNDSKMIWQQCVSTFRPSRGDLLADYVDPVAEQHMELPPILATLGGHMEEPMSVHYFAARRDEYDSDSEVECVALPASRTSSRLSPVPLRRSNSTYDSGIFRR